MTPNGSSGPFGARALTIADLPASVSTWTGPLTVGDCINIATTAGEWGDAGAGCSGLIPGTFTSTQVLASYPPASNAGKTVYTTDFRWLYSDGIRWNVTGTPPIPAGAAMLGYTQNVYTRFPVQSEIVLSRGTTKADFYAGLSFNSGQPVAGSFGTDATTGQLELFYNQASNPGSGEAAQLTTVTSQNTTSLTTALGNIPPAIGSRGFYFEAAYTIPTDNSDSFNALYVLPWQHNASNTPTEPGGTYPSCINQYAEFDINENGHGTDQGGYDRGAYVNWNGSSTGCTETLTAAPTGTLSSLTMTSNWAGDTVANNCQIVIGGSNQVINNVTTTAGSPTLSFASTTMTAGATASVTIKLCSTVVNNSHTAAISYTTEHIFGGGYDPVAQKFYVWVDGVLQDTLSTNVSGTTNTFRDTLGYDIILQMASHGANTPGTLLLRYVALWTGPALNASGSGSGTVNSGTAGQIAQYSTTGTAVSGATVGAGLTLSSNTLSTTAPSRTVTASPTVASTDMGGTIYSNVSGGGTITIPAISSSILASGMTVQLTNYSTSTAAISTTPTINSGGGCVTATGIPSGDTWQIQSNGTTLDCVQTVASGGGSGTVNSGTSGQVAYYASTGTAVSGTSSPAFTNVTFSNLTAGAPSSATTWNYGTGAWSGTGAFAATPNRAAAYWNVITDTAAFPNTGVGSTGLAGGLEWYDHLTSGWDGFRFGYECYILVDSAPQTISNSGSQVSTNLNCIKDRVQVNVNMGGLAGSYGGANGTAFGFNPFVTAQTNATSMALLSNEVDINSTAFAGPGASKYGFNVTLAGSCGSSTCSSESIDGYDNIAYLAGDADDKGTSYWWCIFCTGTEAHGTPANYTTTLLGAKRRFLGSGTYAFNTPTFKYGVDLNAAQFSAPLVGTYSTAISAITPDATNTAYTLTFGTMTSAPPAGSIVTISGATGTAAVYNGGHVVIGNGTATTALVASDYIATTLVTCSSGCGTATVTLPQGQAWQSPDAAIGPSGTISGSAMQVGSGGVTSGTATIGSITVDPQPFGGYVGGALFGGGNPTINVYTPNGETAPTVSAINSFVSAALLYTDLTHFVSSAAAAPNGTQVATGCNNGDVIALTSGTYSTQATFTVSTDGAGHATAVAITNPGAFTVMGGTSPTWTTTGACTTATINTWLQVGFGISSVTLSANGAGYPPAPAPHVYITGYTGTINTRPHLVANLSVTPQPLTVNPGAITAASWGTGGIILGASGTQNLIDSTASDAATTLGAWALPVYNFECNSGTCSTTNLDELYIPAPTNTGGGGTWSAANLYALHTAGQVKLAGGGALSGNYTINNGAGSNTTQIGTGTTTGAVTLGGSANNTKVASPLVSAGTTFTLGTGTGACATTSVTNGGTQAGAFTCTGTAGASTIIINMGNTTAVPHGYACHASDVTSGVVWAQVTPVTTTTCKLTGTIATTGDTVVFSAMGY